MYYAINSLFLHWSKFHQRNHLTEKQKKSLEFDNKYSGGCLQAWKLKIYNVYSWLSSVAKNHTKSLWSISTFLLYYIHYLIKILLRAETIKNKKSFYWFIFFSPWGDVVEILTSLKKFSIVFWLVREWNHYYLLIWRYLFTIGGCGKIVVSMWHIF